MHSFATSSVVALTLASIAASQTTGSFNPCHDNRNEGNFGAFDCEKVLLNVALTKECLLKPPQADGTFTDCTSIYDIDQIGCMLAIRRYVALNPCDEKRAANFIDYYQEGDLVAKQELDYFLYSLAEECCDCIPQRPDDGSELAVGTLSVYRGNCPAHAVYDICVIYPNIKLITANGRKDRTPDAADLPYICPQLDEWLASDAARGWAQQNVTVINDDIAGFLSEAMNGLKCRTADIWDSCLDLESKQGRV